MSSASAGVNEVSELFDLMDSTQPSVVQDIKNLIQENFNTIKDSWLVGGLYDYYIQTHSNRCMEILIGISREPHDRFLIEKVSEGFRTTQNRKQSLIFFGHLVRKQPSWLYKISNLGLMKELIKILKTETDMVILLTGLLSITTILPIIPSCVIPFINDVFDVFGRLAIWAHTSHNIAEEHLLHLQVGLYSLFHRLYAMYPCNFLSYLRHNFSSSDKKLVFLHAIKPMLETVKMHPMLVTATKEGELSASRWRNKEYHDIIAECAQLSLDVLESGLPEELSSIHLKPRQSTVSVDYPSAPNHQSVTQHETPLLVSTPMPNQTHTQVSSLIQQALKVGDTAELSSLSSVVDESAPPTPLTTGGGPMSMSTSATSTPGTSTSTTPVIAPVSPPEAAMEATPENTPIPTPVKDRERVHFKLPTPGSPAVAHLAFGPGPKALGHTTAAGRPPPQTPPCTPVTSVPSSPAPQTGGGGGGDNHGHGHSHNHISGTGNVGPPVLHRRDSIFDSMRRDSVMYQRLQKVMIEQQTSGGKDELKRPSPITLGDTVVTLEPIPGSLPESGPLTPMLTSVGGEQTIDLVDENEDHVCNTACPIGAMPMPDTRSMMAFAKRVSRLRYYSHCGDQSSDGPSPGTSPSGTTIPFHKSKRSNSCPDIYKRPITEEFSDSDSTDGISASSQTHGEDRHPESGPLPPVPEEVVQPYEQFFDGVLPQFLQCPGQNQSQIESPHHLLDVCLSKAAALHGRTSVDEDNIVVLKGQVELLHSQLLFERHRRESHALRNRSLAKKCRNIQQKEELNFALRSQLHSLEKEVATLKKEILIQRSVAQVKEKELQQTILDLESRVENYRKEISSLHESRTALEGKYSSMNLEYQILLKESDQRRADIFQLENENKHCRKFVEINAELKSAYESAQKEVILLGELCRRQQEIMSTYEPNRHILHEMEDLRTYCEQEVNDIKDVLQTKSSETEAALGFVKSLQEQLTRKDVIIEEQKKLVQEVGVECDIQLKALNEKYETVKNANHRLELEIINLQHQLTLKTYATRAAVVRRISPSNGESSHNSNASDVDSAASAGGMQLSPDQDRSGMFIFGSPQFDQTTFEMSDLQSVIDNEHPPQARGSRSAEKK